jgi:tripartite-type tricarboxylate transporter receptor subunit TctC
VKFDPMKFAYIGSANAEVSTCVVRKDAAVQKFDDVFTTPVIIGSSGGTTHDLPAAMNATLGTKLRIVGGYPGTRDVLLAMDKGEVQGLCGMGYTSVVAQRPEWLKPDSPARFLVQESLSSQPALEAAHVPRSIDYAKTPEQRAVLEVVYAHLTFTRPFLMGDGTPKDRVEAVRAAFLKALADPDLLAEAEKQGLEVTAMSGQDLEGRIRALYATPADVVARVKAAIAEP